MPENIADEHFEKLLQILEQYVGTSHLKLRKRELHKSLSMGAAKLGFSSTQELIDNLIKSNGTDGIDSLIEYFTVGETYFFRHKECFDVIKSDILPKLAEIAKNEGRSELNVWCAACSSGEEPYSLAMLLDNTALPLSGCQINIYASDINQDFLKRAAAGIYSEWSFRELPEAYLHKYLKPVGKNSYELEPRIRKKVKFFSHNLLSPEYPEIPARKLDLIICRNVLIYFNKKQIHRIFNKFQSLLHDEGRLLTSPAEVAADPDCRLKPVNCSGVYFYGITRAVPEQSAAVHNNIQHSLERKAKVRQQPERRPKPIPRQSKPTPEEKPPEKHILPPELLKMAKDRKTKVSPEQAADMARYCADAGRLELALHWSNIAIDGDNLNPEMHYLQAQILRESGNIDAALRELKNVLFLNPDFIAGYFTSGMLQLKSGNPKEALRNLRNAAKLLSTMDDSLEVAGCEGVTVRNMRETIIKIISQ
ncbi:MAG: CheR family methyltransferase [Victivallaceae bacterium]|jgi:chemotaxis protein methyltransferase CheR